MDLCACLPVREKVRFSVSISLCIGVMTSCQTCCSGKYKSCNAVIIDGIVELRIRAHLECKVLQVLSNPSLVRRRTAGGWSVHPLCSER